MAENLNEIMELFLFLSIQIIEIMRLVIKFCQTVAFKIDLDLWLKVRDTLWHHGYLSLSD